MNLHYILGNVTDLNFCHFPKYADFIQKSLALQQHSLFAAKLRKNPASNFEEYQRSRSTLTGGGMSPFIEVKLEERSGREGAKWRNSPAPVMFCQCTKKATHRPNLPPRQHYIPPELYYTSRQPISHSCVVSTKQKALHRLNLTSVTSLVQGGKCQVT